MSNNKVLFKDFLEKNLQEKELNWVLSIVNNEKSIKNAFVLTPRFISRNIVNVSHLISNDKSWGLDRLVRIYFILLLEEKNELNFENEMNLLFETAENNESIALLSSLYFLKQPSKWILKATDAVRSNIGDVFDAIAFDTAYPSIYFSELAWNQLVLKCIFTDKPIHKIIGLTQRANSKLAETLSDFAHERWAAGRTVPAQVWRLVINYVNENIFKDLERLITSEDEKDRIAAYLVCIENDSTKYLLEKFPQNIPLNILNRGWQYLE